MNRGFYFLIRLLLIVAVAFCAWPGILPAQTPCDAASPKAPCLYQPVSGQTEISGVVDGSVVSVDILIDSNLIKSVPSPKGVFTASKVSPLTDTDVITVYDSATPGKQLVPKTAVQSSGICAGSRQLPCLYQPYAGQSVLNGKMTKGTELKLTFNGASVAMPQQPKYGRHNNFTLQVPTISQNTVIQFTRSGAIAGPVPIKRNAAAAPVPPACAASDPRPCIDPIVAASPQAPVTGLAAANSTAVAVKSGSSSSDATVDAKTGKFSAKLPQLAQGDVVTATQTVPGTGGGMPTMTSTSSTVGASPPAVSGSSSSLYTLGLVGADITGASSTTHNEDAFVSFDVMAPVPFLPFGACPKGKPEHPLAQRCWFWMNPRISSTPVAATTNISALSSPSSVSSTASSQTVGQITQNFEFQGGFEYALGEPYNGRQFGWGTSWARSTVSLITSLGATTPLSAINNPAEYALNSNLGSQFQQNPGLFATFPVLAQTLCGVAAPPCPSTLPALGTIKNVAFVLPNRSRFYREYSLGFRLRTYYFSGDCKGASAGDDEEDEDNPACKLQNTYPGTLDVRFGQDESVTAGKLQSAVMTIGGTYPLPGTSGTVRVFGNVLLRLHRNDNTPALVLVPTATAVALTDPSVIVQSIQPSDQDYFHIGIGVDLVALISKWVTPAKSGTGQ